MKYLLWVLSISLHGCWFSIVSDWAELDAQSFGALLSTVAAFFSAFLLKPEMEERRAPRELSGLATWAGTADGGGGGGGAGALGGGGGGAGTLGGAGGAGTDWVLVLATAVILLLLFLCANSKKKAFSEKLQVFAIGKQSQSRGGGWCWWLVCLMLMQDKQSQRGTTCTNYGIVNYYTHRHNVITSKDEASVKARKL